MGRPFPNMKYYQRQEENLSQTDNLLKEVAKLSIGLGKCSLKYLGKFLGLGYSQGPGSNDEFGKHLFNISATRFYKK